MIKFIRLPQVVDATGRSIESHYLDIRRGLMVPPVAIGPRAVAWPAHEIDAICRARLRGDGDDQLRTLVSRLVERRRVDATECCVESAHDSRGRVMAV